MIHKISVEDWIDIPEAIPLIDVRTPAEFLQGHVPGAVNLPLFSNDERVQVGTTYKQVGREEAILLGFDLTGPKWSVFIKQALEISPQKKIGVHCWRGGMRSGAMAWALDLYGFDVHVISGGYKRYRNWVHRQFEKECSLLVLGGMTGSGKTKLLKEMRVSGQQVIDLEDIAQHQGSSYGTMNKLVQPTQEQFENNLANCLKETNTGLPVWVEDESLTIGKRSIPKAFWLQMRKAVMIDIHVPLAQRIEMLVAEYGILDKGFLVECTERIRKRLGPEQTKHAVAAINEGRMADFIRLVLAYYDKTYRTGLATRDKDNVLSIELNMSDLAGNVKQVLDRAKNIS